VLLHGSTEEEGTLISYAASQASQILIGQFKLLCPVGSQFRTTLG
jgi:hypothetical protein